MGYFLPFTLPPKNRKNQNFEKIKKMAGYICYFGPFFAILPPSNQKNLKKMKKSHKCAMLMQINIIPLPVTINRKIKTTGQIKFSAVIIKQNYSYDILYVNEFNILVQVLLLHSFIYSISCLVIEHKIYYYIF